MATATDVRYWGDGETESDRAISEFLCIVAKTKPQDENAEQVYRWALELWPENAVALNSLGRIFMERKDYHRAAGNFFGSFATSPDPRVLINRSLASRGDKYYQEAVELAEECVARWPDYIPAYLQLVSLAQETGTLYDVETAVRRGLAVDPNDAPLRFALSTVLLARGDYGSGWKEYEFRPSRMELLEKCDNVQEWKGEPLDGKKLLVIGEQGLGDQIMFSRYLEEMPRSTLTVFMTRPELARLFASNPTINDSKLRAPIVTSDRENVFTDFDYWVGLCSLPLILRYALNPVALKPVQADIDRFAALIPQVGLLRVGLAWKGNPANPADGRRSLSFEQLEPILNVPGCAFYSLQYGEKVNDPRITELIPYCHDIADQAAAMMNLDLIITCDSMPLHLAGSLDRPCWGMLRHLPDWRWGGKDTTPWYPSIELFRQHRPGAWEDVIKFVEFRLKNHAQLIPLGCEPMNAASWGSPIVMKPTRYGTMSFYRNDTYIGRALDLYGEYSQSEASLLCDLLKPGDVVVEAGANIGGLTLPMAQAVGEKGMVYAFEPQPEYFQLLEKNCESCNGHPISWINEGLSETRSVIHLPRIPTGLVHAPGWKVDGTKTFEIVSIAVDELELSRLNLIKIDVDGMEEKIVRGVEQTIRVCRPYLYIENDKPDCYPGLVHWLIEDAGYKLWQHFAPLYNPDNFAGYRVNVFGNLVSAMLLCVPKERMLDQAIIDKHGLQRVRARKVPA